MNRQTLEGLHRIRGYLPNIDNPVNLFVEPRKDSSVIIAIITEQVVEIEKIIIISALNICICSISIISPAVVNTIEKNFFLAWKPKVGMNSGGATTKAGDSCVLPVV